MASTANTGENPAGLDSLHRLKLIEPPLFLSPSPELSESARLASQYLFSSLKTFVPKCPFSQLLTEGFDSEQIWQQIDLQSQPLLLSLHRQVKHFQEKPEEIEKQFNLDSDKIGNSTKEDTEDGDMDEDDELVSGEGEESDGLERESGSFDEDEEEEEEEGDGDDDNGDDDNDEDDTEMENENDGDAKGVEDKFLKIKELEEYLVDDEEKEYGVKKEQKKRKRGEITNEDEDEDGGEEDEDDEDDDDELGLMGLDDEDDENEMESARYEDFFGGKRTGKGKNDDGNNNQKNNNLSTHEKELEKIRSEIQEMEKANLEPKTWMMQGEVTAAKRPKNSALGADLEFVHNVRPAPVITEEVTASLEELIKKRIVEGHFDDVQKPATLPSKSPREKIELDENKNQKGLAELYEHEYVQKTGLVSTALSFADEQKKDASLLFKKLCLKLDSLSHSHFSPKPVIEDMSIQTNVPALAMEEVAPVAVSDAAMLAPEEVFAGKGDVKEETELTKADRKRRRANKKRKFKAETIERGVRKAQLSSATNNGSGNEES